MDLLSAVEQFFGEPLTQPVVDRAARGLSFDDACVLADQLESVRLVCNANLLEEQEEPTVSPSTTPALLLRSGATLSVALVNELKQLSLYTDLTCVAHPLFEWAADMTRIEEVHHEKRMMLTRLERDLRDLLVLAPLTRAGAVMLVPPARVLETSPDSSEFGSLVLEHIGNPDDEIHMWQDPTLAWLLTRPDFLVPAWELDAHPVGTLEEILATAAWVVRREIPPDRGPENAIRELQNKLIRQHPASSGNATVLIEAVRMTEAHRYLGIRPVATSEFLIAHLRAATALLFGDAPPPPVGPGAGVRFGVPSLHDVSIGDIVRLRLDDHVFAEVRHALTSATNAAAELNPGSHADFASQVRSVGNDLVRPTLDRLTAELGKASRRRFVATGMARGLANLLVMGAAHTFPVLGSARGAAGAAAGKFAATRGQTRRDALRVGVDLLTALTPTVDPWDSPNY